MPVSVVEASGAMGKPPNLLETTGTKNIEQETKIVAVQNPIVSGHEEFVLNSTDKQEDEPYFRRD